MLMVITDHMRIGQWEKALQVDRRTGTREGIHLSTIEQGRMHWEGLKCDAVLVDSDIELSHDDYVTLFCMHGNIIRMKDMHLNEGAVK